MEQAISVGRIVQYKIGEHDSKTIKNNGLNAGDVLPAVIVRTWGPTDKSAVNLRVLCDGLSDAWKTSVLFGDQPGQCAWPKRN